MGLDPRIPSDSTSAVGKKILEANRRIVEETADFAAAFKPNIAFYETYGGRGIDALTETLQLIPDDIPVVLDVKRNDIGATSEAYAKAAFETFGADAVTVNAYMGKDSIDPFLSYQDRGIFVLCRTSNTGAREFQDLEVDAGVDGPARLFEHLASICSSWGRNVGLVVAGNDTEALRTLRSLLPDIWFLAPGIGVQGGTAFEAVSNGARADGLGVLPVVVRSIANSQNPRGTAKDLRDEFNRARDSAVSRNAPGKKLNPLRRRFFDGLIDTGCFQLGEFVLKSGIVSPFYVDLRRIGSDPSVLALSALCYSLLVDVGSFDRIAGIPLAGVPLATALSLKCGVPLIMPRMEPKNHGTGNRIEGEFKKGENVLLVDDLITTGGAKLEAAETLRMAGLQVEHLAVLLERGVSGRSDMEKAGIELHSFAKIGELFMACQDRGIIDGAQRQVLERFLERH